ncbi:MAG: response regulator transcription factor [Prolixibacteraceae bacterium]|nr:response regulator transcription factor [Prolixibacteraceae bacterium]MBN2773637.1 response regulator transcription factor [Prolixibacteraceae bacterium]
MIKALVVEDEKPAADHLLKLINSSEFDIQCVDVLRSVKSATDWFKKNQQPDLIFMDIQLSDGLSFEIFERTKITCPVIFTTAFEEYAIKAFKVNSIDYLLKPVSSESLLFALKKFSSQYWQKRDITAELFSYRVDKVMQLLTRQYKSRFVVNAGVHIRSIETDNIICFYSLEKTTFLFDQTGQSYDINYSLEQLENLNNPNQFFRINRKYIVNRSSIKDIVSYSTNKLKVSIDKISDTETFVSRSRLKDFRSWLEK